MTTPLQLALESLRQGNRAQAEAIVEEAVFAIEKEHGSTHTLYAQAQFDRARIAMSVGNVAEAAASLQKAVDVAPSDDADKKRNLEYRASLGEVFLQMGQLEKAQELLEATIVEREQAYGKNSDGYALAEASLAELYLQQGKLDDAETRIDAALNAFLKGQNAMVLPVAALRASIRAAKHGDDVPLLEIFKRLPAQLQAELTRICLMRLQRDNPKHSKHVLVELKERIEDSEQNEDALPHVVAAINQVSALLGEHDERLEALTWLREHLEGKKDNRQLSEVLLAMAQTYEAKGNFATATETYQESVKYAEGIGPAGFSRVLRTYGLSLSRRGVETEEAERLLRQALAVAEKGDADDTLGNALVALGAHLHHNQKADEAKPLYERALTLLKAQNADAVFAKNHLDAIANNRHCGCGDPRVAFAKAIEMLVRPHLPEGLLKEITVRPDGDMQLNIALERQPTEEEQKLLSNVIGQAASFLRQRQLGAQTAGGQQEGEEPSEFAQKLLALVQPHLPEGLLVSINGTSEKNIRLGLTRQPNEEEQQLLSKLLGEAIGQIKAEEQKQSTETTA